MKISLLSQRIQLLAYFLSGLDARRSSRISNRERNNYHLISIMLLYHKIHDILKKPKLYYIVSLGIIVIIILVLVFTLCRTDDANQHFTQNENVTITSTEDTCTLVTLPNGRLRGRKAFTSRNTKFYAFQEIPYAKPPIGELRFEDPIPSDNWDGILNVTRNTKTCFQYINFLDVINWKESQTEDCLYLNVYTPVCPASGDPLAVMFYIYGSGYLSGTSDYDIFGPGHLMEKGIIVVTFNHRLGPLGFISTGDTVIPGNYGMKDQVLALKWVNKNIRYFGGDPNRVSIVGHSAGASSVALHLMSKLSRGLYSSAICQSGTSIDPWAYQKNHREIAYGLATFLDESFNNNATSVELLQLLRRFPAKEINEAVHKFPQPFLYHMDDNGFIFGPVIEPEHENAFVTGNMYSAIKEGRMDRVPLLIGLVSEEGINKFDATNQSLAEKVEKWKRTAKDLDVDPSSMVLDNMNIITKNKKNQVGKTIRNLYTNKLFADNLGITVKYFSDTNFNRAIIRHAELQSNFSDVYFYRFSYFSSLNGIKPDFEGSHKVGHSDDTIFLWIFKRIDAFEQGIPMDILTRDRYSTLFTNFIKYSNPTPNATALFNNVIWPKARPDIIQFVDINETVTVQKNIKDETYLKWVEIYEEMANKPLLTF